jgi:hypothetical protein
MSCSAPTQVAFIPKLKKLTMRKISAREFYKWGMGVTIILVFLAAQVETSSLQKYTLLAMTCLIMLLTLYRFIQSGKQPTEHESHST